MRIRVGATRILAVVVVAAVLASCGREQARPAGETAVVAPRAGENRPIESATAGSWDTSAGRYLLLPSEQDGAGLLIEPGHASAATSGVVSDIRFELHSGGDSVQSVRTMPPATDSTEACTAWPVVRLVDGATNTALPGWRAGFEAGRIVSLAFDSLPALAARDSATLTREIARAASRVPGDTAIAFRGRPFVVRQANGIVLPDGRRATLAEVTRVVNQEANPLAEQLVLVLEPDSAAGPTLSAVFHHREIVDEEHLASMELIVVFHVRGNPAPAFLIRREADDDANVWLLRRTASGRWVRQWSAVLYSC